MSAAERSTPAGRLADFVEVSILLRPLPSSPWITSCWAMRESTISISHCVESEAHEQAAPLTIIGVRLNGIPQRHRVIDQHTVKVAPQVPLEYGSLEVLCVRPRLASDAPAKPLQWLTPTYPLPEPSYGLTAPECRKQGEPDA